MYKSSKRLKTDSHFSQTNARLMVTEIGRNLRLHLFFFFFLPLISKLGKFVNLSSRLNWQIIEAINISS